MLALPILTVVAAVSRLMAAAQGSRSCPETLSCSDEAISTIDPCCVPSPGGLFIFKQRFEPDIINESGAWGIEGLQVLNCDQMRDSRPMLYSSSYSHEEIGSFCLRSPFFREDTAFLDAEGKWASSEIGEGVEESWERAWSSAGRYISTLAPSCSIDAEEAVAVFFHVLHQLQDSFPTAKHLADADITPSSEVTYSLAELQAALSVDNYRPKLSCDNQTLSTVSWFLNVRGTFQSGQWQASPHAEVSDCPSDGINYPSSKARPRPTATTFDPIFRPTLRPVTLTSDPDRLYTYPEDGVDRHKMAEKLKLGFFQRKNEVREKGREDETEVTKQWHRDEL